MTPSPQSQQDNNMAPPPVMTSDQIMQHVDSVYQGLPDPVKAALDHAHTLTGGAPSTSVGDTTAPADHPSPFRSVGMVAGGPDQAKSLLAPPPTRSTAPTDTAPPPVSTAGSLPLGTAPRLIATAENVPSGAEDVGPPPAMPIDSPNPRALPGAMGPNVAPPHVLTAPASPHATELQRLHQNGPGLRSINNPFLRTVAGIGDVVASGLLPKVSRFIPGTTARNLELQQEEQSQLGTEQAGAKSAAETSKANAEAEEQRSLPDLHKTQAELAAEKISSANSAKDADRAIKQADEERKRGESQQKIAAGLAEHGLKLDPTTKELVPLPYSEMSETQQAAHDLKGAQAELTSARKDYVTAQKNGIPAAQELARKRVEAAQESAATAAGRLGLSRDEFNAQFLGTAPGGAPLAGGEMDESGRPIGTKIAAANKPGATVQGRSAQAGSIIEAGNNLKAEIDKHRDKLGNIGSYWNQAVNGTPISDPDTARLMSEIASYAALQPAMHGMRGGQVMKEFEKMIGGVPKNPEALKAAIDGVAATAGVMQHQGQNHLGVHGGAGAETKTGAKQGDTKTFSSGPNKGKTGTWDGSAYVIP